MDSRDFRDLLYKEKPRYANIHKDIIDKMSKKGGTKSDFISFGPYYQTFMYAFFVGYHLGYRTDMPQRISTTDFYRIGSWKPESSVNYILAVIYTTLNKTGFNWVELEQSDKSQLQVHVTLIVTIMEEYANTGFYYLDEKYKEEPDLFTDAYSFVDLLNNLTKDKQIISE